METETAPRILCVNHWHDDNKGDSAITEGTVRLLLTRWPDARIRIASLQAPDADELARAYRNLGQLAPGLALESSFVPTELGSRLLDPSAGRAAAAGKALALVNAVAWFLRLLPYLAAFARGRPPAETARRLADVDLVVMVGGSNVYDNPSVSAPFSLARLFTVLYPAWAAQRLGIPVVVFGHTLGPFHRPLAMRLAGRVLRRARSVFLREEKSLAAAKALGLDAVRVGPDAAFAVEPRRTPRLEALVERLPAAPAASLALVVRQHPHAGRGGDERVLAELTEFARRALNAGQVEHVLVVVQAMGPTAIEDDRDISRELVGLLPPGRATLVDDDLGPGELAALYGSCRLVVSVRLHAAILAMAGGAPAYAIAYFTAKTAGVMSGAGFPEAWAGHDDVTADGIAAQLDQLLAPSTRGQLAARVAAWRQVLREETTSWPVGGSPRWERVEPNASGRPRDLQHA